MNQGNGGIKVVKSDGSKVSIDLEKIHRMVEKCRNITGVSESSVEMNSGLQFYEGITTREIQSILVKSAHDLISTESPNYQFVGIARLLLFAIQKQVFNTKWKDSEIYPPLLDIVNRNIDHGVYDSSILDAYTEEEFAVCNSYIKHARDLNFTYAGLQQIVDKYLVQDRSSGEVYETPQFMYMLIAMTLFRNYDKEVRLDYVKRYYDNPISNFKINIPTPIMAGVRTPLRQFASCVLVDSDDSLPSIFSSDHAIGKYVAQRRGIGINDLAELGVLGQKFEEVKSSILELYRSSKNSNQQSDVVRRTESEVEVLLSTFLSSEIEDILVLKNNKAQKITELENSIIRYNYPKSFIKDSWKTEK